MRTACGGSDGLDKVLARALGGTCARTTACSGSQIEMIADRRWYLCHKRPRILPTSSQYNQLYSVVLTQACGCAPKNMHWDGKAIPLLAQPGRVVLSQLAF